MKSQRHRTLRLLCLITTAALSTIGLATVGAGAQSTNVPGVTAKSIKLGFIYNGTGAAASSFRNSAEGFQARIDRANAEGGVNGRKIETEIIDDATSGANLTAAQDLVQNRNVFAVVNNSGVGFLSYRFLLGAGVPMIGGGFDGEYYNQEGNENVISASAVRLANGLSYNGAGLFAKKLGGTKWAAIAVSTSGDVARVFQEYVPQSVGGEAVYTNAALDLGTTDVSAAVLGIKKSGADSVYLPVTSQTVIAVMQGLHQNGVTTKVTLGATGYGQDLLDSPAVATLGSNDIFATAIAPVELKTKATKRFQADLKKYSGLTGVPDYGVATGYITADLAVLGLELAGKNPTRQGFIDAIRKHGKYDGAGLACTPLDLSLAAFGKYPTTSCGWYVNVKNGKFVVLNGGKPVNGKLVGDPAKLAANAAGDAAAVTTTTPGS